MASELLLFSWASTLERAWLLQTEVSVAVEAQAREYRPQFHLHETNPWCRATRAMDRFAVQPDFRERHRALCGLLRSSRPGQTRPAALPADRLWRLTNLRSVPRPTVCRT